MLVIVPLRGIPGHAWRLDTQAIVFALRPAFAFKPGSSHNKSPLGVIVSGKT
jgi:hypothetical protein